MKALMYRGPWTMPVEEVDEPTAAAGQVVVDVKAAGICGSDVHGFTGNSGRRSPGIVMGHEFAGTISELGPEMEGYAIGDDVVVMPLFSVAEGADPYPINLSPHPAADGDERARCVCATRRRAGVATVSQACGAELAAGRSV